MAAKVPLLFCIYMFFMTLFSLIVGDCLFWDLYFSFPGHWNLDI